MHDYFDLEFIHNDHRIHVSHQEIPDNWFGDYDWVFTVLVDGNKMVVPGIWRAYKTYGESGIKLVVRAFLNSNAVGSHR